MRRLVVWDVPLQWGRGFVAAEAAEPRGMDAEDLVCFNGAAAL